MKRMLRNLLRAEGGITLIEFVIAIGVGGIVLATFTTLISHSLRTVQSNNYQLEAIRNVDVAGAWFVRNLQLAQTLPANVTLQPGSGNITIVQSTDSLGDCTVTYGINNNGELTRTAGTTAARVAQHITSVAYHAGTAITPSTATITSGVDSVTITKTYNTASRITDFNTVLTIMTDYLPQWDVGVPYDVALASYGGTIPYTWSISSGSLPAWASLDGSSGVIDGNNPTLGTTSFTVKVTDAVVATATKALSITINPQPHDIMPTFLANANIGVPYGPVMFLVSDGTTPKVWSIDSGALPHGLDLSSSGVLSGTPLTDAVNSTFVVMVTDGAGVSVKSPTMSITINGLLAVVTDAASGIGNYTAMLNGHLTGMGGATNVTVSFEYGTTISYGKIVAGVPASLTNPRSFSANISGLTHKTTYHYRAKAVGDNGITVYGNDMTFTTKN